MTQFRPDHPLVLAMKGWDDVRPTSKCHHCKGSGTAPGDGATECGFCEPDEPIDWHSMPWQDLLQEIWDRVYDPNGYPEAMCEEVERRFRNQDGRGRLHMLQDVGSSLWHHFGMTDDLEADCGT